MFVCQWHLRDVFYLGNVGTFDIPVNIIFCSIEKRRLTKGVCESAVVVFSLGFIDVGHGGHVYGS